LIACPRIGQTLQLGRSCRDDLQRLHTAADIIVVSRAVAGAEMASKPSARSRSPIARPAGKRPSIIAPIASYVSVKRRGSIIKIGNFAANFGVRRGVGELYIVHGQNQLAVTLRFPASVI
jgi:hypothetical protein